MPPSPFVPSGPPEPTGPLLLKPAEAAERLGLPVWRVRELMRTGALPSVVMAGTAANPRCTRVRSSDLAAFVAALATRPVVAPVPQAERDARREDARAAELAALEARAAPARRRR